MSNYFETDFNCASSLPYDVTTFPSVTNYGNFDLNAFADQISSIEETVTDEEVVLLKAPLPTVDSVLAADRAVYASLGDARFNGAAAYDFLFTRYKPLDLESSNIPSTTIKVSACDEDGFPYTYTIPNSATYYDANTEKVTLPVYDSRGLQVNFPLKDQYGKYLLQPALTAIDSKLNVVHFPLRDINNKAVNYPFRDSVGTTIITPPPNQDILLDVKQAYEDLNTAFANAKDAHAYSFAEYILSVEQISGEFVGFFYTETQMPAQSAATLPLFAAAIYTEDSNALDLTNITSSKIEQLIRYYPDRSELVYKHYTELGGEGPYTIISPTTSTNIADLIKSENNKLASYNILKSPFWSGDIEYGSYYKDIQSSVTHTSLLEIVNRTETSENDISNLQTENTNLKSLINSLSTQLLSLSAKYEATNINVVYNSAIIDTLATPINWINIWTTTAGFVSPAIPATR